MCADYLETLGLEVVDLKENTLKKLEASGTMHPAYSRHNPLDLVGDALPERYQIAINTLLSEDYVDGMIVIQTLQTMTDPIADAQIVVDAHHAYPAKPILCVYMGGKFSQEGIRLLQKNNIPDFNDLKKAAVCMRALCERKRN